MQKEYKNILVVRTDKMGDVVVSTPALQALRANYPDAKITLLVSPYALPLVENNTSVNEIIVDDRKNQHKGLFGSWRLVAEIRQKKFDLAIVFHTKRRTNFLCWAAGIPKRLGYKNDKFGFLLNMPIEDRRHLSEKHEVEYCLDLLKSIDVHPKDPKLHVSLNVISDRWVVHILEQHDIYRHDFLVGIHMGASDPVRRWPTPKVIELINQIKRKHLCEFVLVGDEDICPAAQEVLSKLNFPVLDLTGRTTLSQMISMINRCNLFISNDSGPVHVAAALKTPVVAIFTRNQPGINPPRWRPWTDKAKVVSVKPTNNLSFKKAKDYDPESMEPIEVEAVLQAVDALWKLC